MKGIERLFDLEGVEMPIHIFFNILNYFYFFFYYLTFISRLSSSEYIFNRFYVLGRCFTYLSTMPLQQVSRVGGPNQCFGQFQKAIECMTNPKTKSNDECANFKNDFVECRRHRLETYKMTIMKDHLEKKRPDLNKEEVVHHTLRRETSLHQRHWD